MTAQQFAHALGATESNNNPNAPLGDDGRALGQYQAHPDWICTYAKVFNRWARLNETWDSWIGDLVVLFYGRYSGKNTDVQVAMWYHLGHFSTEESADWDAVYAARFTSVSQ